MEGIDAIDVTPRTSYGPPTEPPPPEIEHKPEESFAIKLGEESAASFSKEIVNVGPQTMEIPAKRKRATKAEMEARRAAEGKRATVSELDEALKILMPPDIEANLPAHEREIGCADSMLPDDDLPMPPEEPTQLPEVPVHIQSAVAKWKTVIINAESETELDSAWNTHISAIQGQMPDWVYNECINMDDERRGEIV